MLPQINEPDWKILRQVHPVALGRYCQRVLSEIAELASASGQGSHQRYLDVFDLVKRRDKELASAFNDMRRSTALLRLAWIQSLGLLTEDEFAQFSPETRETIRLILSL